MKNSAVEFIIERLAENGILHSSDVCEAKELERQNLYSFYIQGGIDCVSQADRTVEDFYNETLKTK